MEKEIEQINQQYPGGFAARLHPYGDGQNP